EVERDFGALEASARAFLDQSQTSIEGVYADRWADLRYVAQSHEVAVPVKAGPVDFDVMYADFQRLQERFYGTRLGDPTEIVNLRVTVTGQVPRVKASPFRP